jgi:sulfur-carrier protein
MVALQLVVNFLMPTTVLIPRILSQYVSGQQQLLLEGQTVHDLLLELQRQHPALYQCVCTESGAVRRHIHLFVNNSQVNPDQLQVALHPTDVVAVFQAVSGG